MPLEYPSKLSDQILISCLAMVSVAALSWVEFAPAPLGNVAVVFPPWVSPGEGVRRTTAAGATIVKRGEFASVLIVHPTSQEFVRRAIVGGALLVFNAAKVRGCDLLGNQSK